MKNLYNPRWLLLINTLPLLLLFSLEYGQFNVIKTLLDEKSIHLWVSFAAILAALGAMTLAYAVVSIRTKQAISPVFTGISFAAYAVYLYLYCYNYHEIVPFSIPRWMLSGDTFVYVGTFIMPTLAYNFFCLLSFSTREEQDLSAGTNFAIALTVPILWYIFTLTIFTLRNVPDPGIHFIVILCLAGTLMFLFFGARGIYILSMKKGEQVSFQIFHLTLYNDSKSISHRHL